MNTQRLVILLFAALSLPCAAQNAVTVYGGARGGGGFDTTTSPTESITLGSSGAGSISFDWAIDPSRQAQIFASYQSTDLAATTSTPAMSLNVSYLHLGGTNYFSGAVGRGAYVVGGLGVTRLAPGLAGLSTEFFPSINLGVGYQLPISGTLSLRLELRTYITLVNSSTNLFCSGGCVVAIKGDGLAQTEALIGLSFGF